MNLLQILLSAAQTTEDVAKKEFTPKETACSSGSKEYNTFIDTIVSVVEKYGAEILEEIDCAV